MTRFLNILIFILIITFFAACSTDKKEPKNKNQLIFASTKDIRDINPHLYRGEMAAQNMVFESLVINTEEGIKPWLAKSWDISKDGKNYTFHLRDNIFFSDGTAFTAEVVKKNFDAVMENRIRHSWMELINEINYTEVIDPYTFKINLKNAYYPTLIELSLTRPFRFISPNCFKNNKTKDGVNCYIGTGPWILKEHKKNNYTLFEENKNYWNIKPKITSVKWRVIPDHQSLIFALEKGEIDLIFGSDGDMIDLNVFTMLEKNKKYSTILSNPIASRTIVINTNREITKDIKVREALEYAIDKKSIVSGILNGTEKIADTLFSKNIPYSNIPLSIKEYETKKANEILEKDGWILNKETKIREKDNKQLHIKLYYNAKNAQEKIISEYIQSNLKDIGIKLSIIGEEKQTFLDRQRSGDFDLVYSLSWGAPYDPQSYISSWRALSHSDYQAQLGLAKKEWLDNQIKAILLETNEKNRERMYYEIFKYIHDQYVYIPLSYSRTKAVFNPNLKGVTFNISQYEIPFEKFYFEE
ncbi:nickel ABC transporter substrate-binding protein [Halarcobacter ebronensis]|uniref:Nickel ABC transporter, nickel/metallophore periplasmic binding protein n=1 Tax=Halarcobacter ebronensis TaxID=1462615 RepID=A0A4Q1AMZ0_9BACT|nr:nickel ABC transporter substrate-binding protein [Halarcobacter ebronensis]QKF82509.1 nickel ABC transporter, periplasmic substrate-binding protein [Halarcobacter ebronensis]RXK07473.1 nickel ABC transporter, nickel/metallophore periplasmic binding protein [Halarcobacter ebronensis]